MTATTETARWRAAGPGDAVALRDLERAAGRAGLGHVFDADAHPYPDADVLARWRATLAEPGVVVEVVEDAAGLAAFVAHDAEWVRHVAVRPDAWGRGLGRQAVDRARARMAPGPARLWVLERNDRARGLYERWGWRATGARQVCRWEPYPTELEYAAEAPGA